MLKEAKQSLENIALKELSKLAVNKYRARNYQKYETFSDVYFEILHECDMYEEGEESPLNKKSYNSAKKWLYRYSYLK